MPHKHKPRRNKLARMLTSREQTLEPKIEFIEERENKVSKMNDMDILEVRTIIQQRYDSARDITEAIAIKMDQWDKLYDGEFLDPTTVDEDSIFLPKTREQVQAVYAYIMLLVSQLNPLIRFFPKVTSLWASSEEYKRAKVAEALMDFYFSDLWKIRDDVFPKWLKNFLKHSMAVWKVTYREDDFLPDLDINVVDRAFLYIDPTAHDLKEARWVVEKYFLPRSEVIDRVNQGHWHLDKKFHDKLESGYDNPDSGVLKRYFGENWGNKFSIKEDDLVEVWDYWQAPRQGLDDAYAVILGGEGGDLVRYGRNPFPYKGLPYRAKSYDPDEYQPDGTGLVEMYRPVQEIVNNFLNMRIKDVRSNIIRPVAATGKFVDQQTMDDFKDGHKIVRLSEEVMEASMDPSFDLRKHFVELPFATSTQELLVADLPFILGQGKEIASISDVFRGQAPPHQATLGQVQEQLSRNQGVFRPIYLQVMRGFEELAEICMEYFKDPLFFPADRIIQIVGENKYEEEIQGWHKVGSDLSVRQVSPDEMDVDVTYSAVSGADALASRTFLMSSLEQIFQSIGQIPELFQELREELDFARIVEFMLDATGHDTDAVRLSDQEKQKKAQMKQQQQQEAVQQQMAQQKAMQDMQLAYQKQLLEIQTQMSILLEQSKGKVKAESQVSIDQNKVQSEVQKQSLLGQMETEQAIRQIVAKEVEKLKADLVRMNHEARLEAKHPETSVGHGNNINDNRG